MPSIVSEYQILTKIQQNFKKSIMMIVGACIFLIAAATALPRFFGYDGGSGGQ